MYSFIRSIARILAIIGGILLTVMALMTTLSVLGGSISKIGNAGWMETSFPVIADMLKATGIRTIPGMYEIMSIGMAFCIFSFLPVTQLERGHAVVDVFTGFLPKRHNQALVTLWEVIFCIVLIIITWRLFFGMERLMKSNMIFQDLQIPQWWGYAVAFVQMLLASLVAAYTSWAQIVKLTSGRDIMSRIEGASD